MSVSDQALQYYEHLRAGKSPQEAIKLAFPDGLPSAEDRQKEAAKKQQEQALGAVGGTLVGALGTTAAMDAVRGEPILGGIFGSGAGEAAASAGSAAQGVAAPELVGALRVPEAAAIAPEAASGSGLGSLAIGAIPGIAGGAGLYDLMNHRRGEARGGVQGAASGAALGSYFGPAGTALGAIGGGLFGALTGHKPRFNEEYDRKAKLVEQGIFPADMLGERLPAGRSKEELYDIEMQKQAGGEWANPEFATSRNISDLQAKDIWGYSTPYELLGVGYNNATEDQRLRFNQQLLDEGLVREGAGQISYTDPERAKAIWAQTLGQNPTPVPKRQLTPEELNQLQKFGGQLTAALG